MISTQIVQRTAFASLGVATLTIAVSGWWMVAVRSSVTELRRSASERQKRLSDDRRQTSSLPPQPLAAALDRSRAVSKLRATLVTLTAAKRCVVDEFTASTDEAPYLTTYATDNKDPGWMQVPVRATLRGRSTDVLAAIAGLRSLDVPFEIDTIEFTRRATDKSGMATVGAGIGMRVLVYRGEG